MAYTKEIRQNTSDSHQTSPGYVITFLRWANRDTLNYTKVDRLKTRAPLVVINDAIAVSVKVAKNSPTPVFSCTLKAGDINYATAVHPGDFVTVNMLDWQSDVLRIREKALSLQPINRAGDGFKGLFKIIDVNTSLAVAPNGIKEYQYTVTARAFDELNNILYFNPAIVDEASRASPIYFIQAFGKNWSALVEKPTQNNVQILLERIIKSTIGTGTKEIALKGTKQSTVERFLMPPELGQLLNIPDRKVESKKTGKATGTLYASDINKYYLGIWNPGTTNTKGSISNIKNGFNSFFEDSTSNFFKTTLELPGSRQIAMQDFQMVKVWSLLQNYSNSVLNEMYATYRIAKDGYVYPSIVIRQKPFNTRHYRDGGVGPYKTKVSHTQYLDLPRWKVLPEMITSINLGRSDSARINFVQVFTRSMSVDNNYNQARQLSLGNSVADEKDILRSGMKPYVVTCNFDYPGASAEYRGQQWADLVGDWLLNGHLRMNGTMQCIGIQDPISVGDNLEFDNIVYHIESISHNMVVSATGSKTFRTNLSLSMGVSNDSNSKIPVYAEMDHQDSYKRRLADHQGKKSEKVLPGFSDTQDIPGRTRGEEINETRGPGFTDPSPSEKKK